jgi:flagellin-specific chaperone FliS
MDKKIERSKKIELTEQIEKVNNIIQDFERIYGENRRVEISNLLVDLYNARAEIKKINLVF